MSPGTLRGILLVGAVTAIADVVASIVVARTHTLSARAKAGVLLLVWAIPLFGVTLWYYFLSDESPDDSAGPPKNGDEAYRTAMLLLPDPPGPKPGGTDP